MMQTKEMPLSAATFKELIGGDTIPCRPRVLTDPRFNPAHQLHLCTGHIPAGQMDEADLIARLSATVFPLKYRAAIAGGGSSTSDQL